MYNYNKNIESRYNEASFQILRLHALWQRNHSYFFIGNYKGMMSVLDRIWVELSADAEKKSSTYTKQVFKLDNELYECEKKYKEAIYNLKNKQMNDDVLYLSQKVDETKRRLYSKIKNKEIFLKGLQNHVGKGSSYRNLQEDAII